MNKLPILLSIPHGGTKRPKELENQLCITDKDQFDDSDPFVIEIYNLENKVERVISSEIARAYIDLNRSPQDLPPQNPDGLIKSTTCYQKKIYLKGKEPDESLTKKLIQSYYLPYHRSIQKSLRELDLQLCLDCHSMASHAPNISPDGKNKERPLFCLSNQNGKSSSNKMIELLADCISESFQINRNQILLNNPFLGGYITKTYGNNPIPWIQIEMNRKLYLTNPWFDKDSLTLEQSHSKKLNKQFEESLSLFFSKIDS